MKYFRATFSNGTVLTRSSQNRTYTHAYLMTGKFKSWQDGKMKDTKQSGFSGSADLAHKAMRGEISGYDTLTVAFSEVVPVVETDKKGNTITGENK
jgi:hypothetical protein